jgi:hypothetical protein
MVACGKGANAGRSDGKEELRGSCLLTSVSLHDEVHPAEGPLAEGRRFIQGYDFSANVCLPSG